MACDAKLRREALLPRQQTLSGLDASGAAFQGGGVLSDGDAAEAWERGMLQRVDAVELDVTSRLHVAAALLLPLHVAHAANSTLASAPRLTAAAHNTFVAAAQQLALHAPAD